MPQSRNNPASGIKATAVSSVEMLWQEEFFREERNLSAVSARIAERWGHNFLSPEISKALSGASFLIRVGKAGSYRYKQKVSPTSKKIASIEEQLFSTDLISKLGARFTVEVDDLHLNFGTSGNCTAFLLRKILEKAIFLAFAKNGLSSQLDDKSKPGMLIGLEAMIDTAAREKIGGIPFLLSKTAKQIKGIKFLGDTSAHNPLVNVDMETILPQMPYIITAYKELAEKL